MGNNPVATPQYEYGVIKQFTVMTVIWGIVGMAVGVLIASQLAWPAQQMALRNIAKGISDPELRDKFSKAGAELVDPAFARRDRVQPRWRAANRFGCRVCFVRHGGSGEGPGAGPGDHGVATPRAVVADRHRPVARSAGTSVQARRSTPSVPTTSNEPSRV